MAASVAGMLYNALIGVLAGAIVLGVVQLVGKLRGKSAAH